MTITMRPCRGEADFPRLTELLRDMPSASRHLVDLPWRISSPALQSGLDAYLWEDERGILHGFAAWQVYWAALDYFIRPGHYQPIIETELFHWVTELFQELDRERGRPLPYWGEFRDDDVQRRTTLEAHGFLLDDDFSYLQMSYPLSTPLQEPVVPKGFTIRPLAGIQEVESYVELHRAAFASTSMTIDWRLRTLRTPQYQPELDLVAVAPNGTLADFCVGWLDQERSLGQVEPLGVHPHFQHIGLGQALLCESLRRFKAHGANSVLVETEDNRSPALQTYKSVGFQPIHTIFRKGKRVTQ